MAASNAASNPILFEDQFEVLQKDPDGKRFDKVSRFVCRSTMFDFELTFDVNVDVYPLAAGDRLTVALARTIHLDGTAETGRHDASSPLVTRAASLMDGYEYVMHGRVFKYTGAGGGGGGGGGSAARGAKVEMVASFGGLLLKLGGEASKLQLLEVDSAVYLLVRKL